jgi:hypothetical protein
MGKYTEKGICIWCLKSEPEVSFNTAPHTISKQLGKTPIGFDICDVCNHYFGTGTKTEMSIELAFKEIMNLIRFLLKHNHKTPKNSMKLKSIYFDFFESKKTIRIRNAFNHRTHFIEIFTRQFKKGMYLIFLQEYHRITKNGLDARFNNIRKFVRFDLGDLPIYFLENNGCYLIQEDLDEMSFTFNEIRLAEIDVYGFCPIWMYGNPFYIEVTPTAYLTREVYLTKRSRDLIGSGFVFKKLRKLERITDLDFTLRSLYS